MMSTTGSAVTSSVANAVPEKVTHGVPIDRTAPAVGTSGRNAADLGRIIVTIGRRHGIAIRLPGRVPP